MTDHDALTALAGEYVLGTLEPAERAAFTARLTGDAVARRAVADWQERLAPLLADAAEVAPPADLWRKVEARIAALAANDDRVSPVWRSAAIAASLLAALGGALALRPNLNAPSRALPTGAGYVAVVTAGGAEPALLVTMDGATGRAVVRAVGLASPRGGSLELWYIGPGRDPRSLGLVGGDMRAEFPLSAMMRGDAPEAAVFAITTEPAGGAPGGKPTGAIVYSGRPIKVSAAS